ncbi:hypothetical protein ACFLUJ_00065 [Chloroflexota bacterium]
MQKYHLETEARLALEVTGFTGIQAYAYDGQLGLQELTGETEGGLFVCRKPVGVNSG